jgi:hypothetical protein
MPLVIDDAFIQNWHPKYDLTENDEREYQRLVVRVAEEMASGGTISQETFLAIWNWKGAMRVIGHVLLNRYDTLYAEAFRRIPTLPLNMKLPSLLAGSAKLPGFGAPTGTTLIHFIHPQTMPIIDVRTAEVLWQAGIVSTDRTGLEHYEEFRRGIQSICQRGPRWTLREIDRALFAYHKQVLDTGRSPTRCSMSSSVGADRSPRQTRFGGTLPTNHNRFAQAFAKRVGGTFSTPEIMKIMLAETDIQAGSVLPNDHGEGNKGQCPCVGTDRQIFDRVDRGIYRVRQYRSA